MTRYVKQWQNQLIHKGYLVSGQADGVFGPKTLEASMAAIDVKPSAAGVEVVERIGDTQLIISTCRKCNLLRNQCAYVLATAFWETNRTMLPVEEAYWLSDEWRKANLRYWPWHGRGYVQLTWKSNYHKAEDELGLPFTENPALALQSGPAAEILVAGMMDGWFTSHKLSDYVTITRSDFVNARRVVNGMDKAKAIAAIAEDYDRDLKEEGYE